MGMFLKGGAGGGASVVDVQLGFNFEAYEAVVNSPLYSFYSRAVVDDYHFVFSLLAAIFFLVCCGCCSYSLPWPFFFLGEKL